MAGSQKEMNFTLQALRDENGVYSIKVRRRQRL
jgi:hypothetical protein